MIENLKRSNDELKADRPTLEEIQFIPKSPISFMLENIRSVYNVGSIFRTADGFGAANVYLTGYTAKPPRDDLNKTALGADKVVPWIHFENPSHAIKHMISKKITPVVLEQTKKSVSIYDVKFDFPVCLILGNEVEGVSEEISRMVKFHVEIPMSGIKQSLNVSVAAGITGFEILRQYLNK
tara:strand:+ start:305 stop:847 length:543 start_codon:yes stop_codon:yes gene_type:complete